MKTSINTAICNFILTIGLFVLCGCSSQPPSRSTSSIKQLKILISANRQLELEPCGCSLSQHGGLERVWNFTANKKMDRARPLLHFVSGTSFVPEISKFDVENKSFYLSKSGFLMEALGALEVTAVSPSYEDLYLSAGHLKNLANQYKVPLVSTNLVHSKTGKPLFPRSLEIEKMGISLLVVGLAGKPTDLSPKVRGVRAEDPVASLKAVLSELPPSRDRIVIVLSSLSPVERMEIIDRVPGIHFIFGGPSNEIPGIANQYRGSTVYFNPEGGGRKLYELDLDLQFPIAQIYNSQMAASHEETRVLWSTKLKEVKTALDTTTESGARRSLSTEADNLTHFLERSATVPTVSSPGATLLDFNLVALGPALDGNPNPMTGIINRFKESLH